MKAKQHTLIVLLVFVLAAGAALALLTHANQKACLLYTSPSPRDA